MKPIAEFFVEHWILIPPLWLICSVIAYGAYFAFYQGNWPRYAKEMESIDRRFALTLCTMGPISLIVAIFSTGFFKHGFIYRSPHEKSTDTD